MPKTINIVKPDIKRNPDILMNSMFDPIFKSIVQNPNFKSLLSLIISHVTVYSPSYIYENLVFSNTELPVENYKERKKITDIMIKVEGTIINIEANRSVKASMVAKNNLYHHKIAYDRYLSGVLVDNSEVFQLNFNVINRFDDRLFIEFSMKDDTGKFTDEENFKRIHINMVKPLEKYYNSGKESLSKLEKILVMFQITSRKKLRDISKGDEELENMAKIIEDLNEDEYIIGLYDKDKMDEWMKKVDHAEAVREGHKEGHKKGLEDGRKEGLEEGRKEGLKQGLEQGLEQGIEQGIEQGSKNKTLEIAQKMLDSNMKISDISKFTGLSENEIKKLKAKE